jgi:hypothetical protein
MSFAQILPLAFVMIAGPQIISAFFLATSDNWAKSSVAYVSGAAVSITTIVTIAYLVARGAKSAAGDEHGGTVDRIIEWIVLALVVALAVRVYLTRKTTQPPKWMGKLQSAQPKFAFALGALLLGVFPTDILTSVTVGLHVGHKEDAWWQCLPFIGLTLLFLATPSLIVMLLGRRADTILPKVRDWMSEKSWVVSEIVLVFFAGVAIDSLLS